MSVSHAINQWKNGVTLEIMCVWPGLPQKGLSICHHSEFNYVWNSYVLSMCFVRYRDWIVCTICNAAPMSFFRGSFYENFGIPLLPQVHMLQYRDHSGYCWIQLILNNLFVAKFCCGHWSNFRWLGRSFFSVTLSCKVPYFSLKLPCCHTTDSWVWPLLSRHLCFWYCYMQTSPMVCSLMYGGLVSTGPTSYCTSHIMNSTNPWIRLLNEFIYNWKSLISLLAKSCAILVALWYLTHLVIFPSVHISSARMYVCSMYQVSKMAWWLVWFELCCVKILVWCEMCCVKLPLWHLL